MFLSLPFSQINELFKKIFEDCQLISQQKLCRPEEIGKKYSELWKASTYNQDYSIGKAII